MAASATDLALGQQERDRIAAVPARLRDAFRSGKTRRADWRRGQLRAVERLLRENVAQVEKALAEDLGKPAFEAYTADLGFPMGEAAVALKSLDKWMKPRRVSVPLMQQPGKAWVQLDPLGVVLIIVPWNYPIQLSFNPLVAAIAAGNCAVIKPSELAPATSAVIAELIAKYLDNDCFAVVEGGVSETQVLLDQRFDHILYTGNGRVGRVVMEAAARHLTPVTLELGGKSPVIVMPDADLDVAAHRIGFGKWINAGQTCTAPDYVLVHQDVERPLIDKLRGVIAEFYGPDPKASKDYGRIVSERHVERLEATLAGGGEIVVGGEVDRAARYVAPTIVRDVAADSRLMQEEVFGPILPVVAVRDLDAAIAHVRDHDKPLALYVFSSDRNACARVLAETSSGGACLNGTLWQAGNPHLPFGGVGPSGMGAYHGRWGFEALSHRKAVADKPTRIDPKIAYPPYTRLKEWVVRKFL